MSQPPQKKEPFFLNRLKQPLQTEELVAWRLWSSPQSFFQVRWGFVYSLRLSRGKEAKFLLKPEDGDESSDYSSANESFLDEDPKSSNDPDVLGLVAQGMGPGNLAGLYWE